MTNSTVILNHISLTNRTQSIPVFQRNQHGHKYAHVCKYHYDRINSVPDN